MNEIRRKDRAMDKKFAISIIDKAKYCTQAMVNQDGIEMKWGRT